MNYSSLFFFWEDTLFVNAYAHKMPKEKKHLNITYKETLKKKKEKGKGEKETLLLLVLCYLGYNSDHQNWLVFLRLLMHHYTFSESLCLVYWEISTSKWKHTSFFLLYKTKK